MDRAYYIDVALKMYEKCGIVLNETKKANIELADFALHNFEKEGLILVTYINNNRYCAKEMVLLPRQTCAEHRHPALSASNPGKQETFRCRMGTVYLYVEGKKTEHPACQPPKGSDCYTVFHEIKLEPGEQYTIMPNTLHWFQSGDKGAVISEFSSTSDDASDIFTDKNIIR